MLVQSFAANSESITTLTKDKEIHEEREREWFKEQAKLVERIDLLETKIKEGGAGPGAGGDPKVFVGGNKLAVPLVLDISMGKPLWDRPLGRVIAVNGDKVLIHVNTQDGAVERLKTGLTFNVFATGKDAMADGTLKATIEVISLEGGKAAIGRITARFGKIPVNEDDSIFNSVWGTHVAVVGQVNLFSKQRGESQVEQNRSLQRFLSTLERQGVIVDAYIDLLDGSVKGKYGDITPKTQFLIVGNELNPNTAILAAKAAAPDTGDDNKNTEIRNKLGEEAAANVAKINGKIGELRQQAANMGIFHVSPDNFAAIAGQRKLGGYSADEVPFEPTLPAANVRQ